MHGLSGIHTHMTNTMNTPIEALEHTYPLMIEQYGLRYDSGGEGLHRGGNGIIRSYRFLEKAHVSLLTERRKLAPYGLDGGKNGLTGKNELVRKTKRRKLAWSSKLLAAGDGGGPPGKMVRRSHETKINYRGVLN